MRGRPQVPRERVRTIWTATGNKALLARTLTTFRTELEAGRNSASAPLTPYTRRIKT